MIPSLPESFQLSNVSRAAKISTHLTSLPVTAACPRVLLHGQVPGSYFECLGPDNHPPQYPIYLVPDIRNGSMGLVPERHFGCLGPDNHPPQYPIYLVPDIRNDSMGLVPESYFGCLGPVNVSWYLVPNIKNVSLGPVPDINNGDWD